MNSAADAVFQFKKMLKNLDQCMQKAAAYADQKKFDVNILAESRLAPDMFSFTKQIQSACDSAKFCAAYLSSQTAPKHEDNETTWTQLRERIHKAVSYLEGLNAGDFDGFAAIQVKPGWAKGKWIQGDKYLSEIAIPNFYFHLTVAYAILRNCGVDVGKMDYLGNVNLN